MNKAVRARVFEKSAERVKGMTAGVSASRLRGIVRQAVRYEHIPAAIAYAADLARERIVPPITNRGEAVAALAPSEGAAPKDKPAAVEKFKAFLQEHPVRGVADVAALIDEGRA